MIKIKGNLTVTQMHYWLFLVQKNVLYIEHIISPKESFGGKYCDQKKHLSSLERVTALSNNTLGKFEVSM